MQKKSRIPNPKQGALRTFIVGIWSLGFGILFLNISFAANVNTGVAAGNFLKLGAGVRAMSIGGAFIAVADDPYAVYWNPAGLSQLKSIELTSTYSTWFSGVNYGNIAGAFPYGKSTIGFLANYVNIGQMEETTQSKPAGTGNIFNSNETALYLAYSQRILPGISLGGDIKALNQNITGSAASGYGIDLGALWRWEDYIVGFSARNILGSMGGKTLTNNYGLGICYRLNPYLFAVDANLPNDNKPLFNFGLGYNYNDLVLTRIGFNTRSEENAGGNFSIGFGYNYKNFKIDYAFIPYGDLGQSHKISISLYPFGTNYPSIEKIKIVPSSIKVKLNQKVRFKIEGINSRYDVVDVVPKWSVEGNIGEISADNGIFTAKKLGKGKIIAKVVVYKKVSKKPLLPTAEAAAAESNYEVLIDSSQVEVVRPPAAKK